MELAKQQGERWLWSLQISIDENLCGLGRISRPVHKWMILESVLCEQPVSIYLRHLNIAWIIKYLMVDKVLYLVVGIISSMWLNGNVQLLGTGIIIYNITNTWKSVLIRIIRYGWIENILICLESDIPKMGFWVKGMQHPQTLSPQKAH